eukprot:Gb_02295 [translate_table: standard]
MEDDATSGDELDLPNVSTAVSNLEALVGKGVLKQERAFFARQKIEELHAAFVKSKETQMKLQLDNIDLSARLQVEFGTMAGQCLLLVSQLRHAGRVFFMLLKSAASHFRSQ